MLSRLQDEADVAVVDAQISQLELLPVIQSIQDQITAQDKNVQRAANTLDQIEHTFYIDPALYIDLIDDLNVACAILHSEEWSKAILKRELEELDFFNKMALQES